MTDHQPQDDRQSEAEVLASYLTRLQAGVDAPPDELDADLADFTRSLTEFHTADTLDRATRDRMWQGALARLPQPEPATATSPDVNRLEQILVRLRRTTQLAAAASILAVILAGALVIAMLNDGDAVTNRITDSPNTLTDRSVSTFGGFVPVVMATREMPPGTQITADMVSVVLWPQGIPLPGPVFDDLDDVVGMFVRGHTSRYMPLLTFNMHDVAPPSIEPPTVPANSA